MVETLAIAASAYVGYATWPWWWATIIGALAGIWNASRRFYFGPWRDRLAASGVDGSRALAALATVCIWSGAAAAALCTALYFLMRWLTAALS